MRTDTVSTTDLQQNKHFNEWVCLGCHLYTRQVDCRWILREHVMERKLRVVLGVRQWMPAKVWGSQPRTWGLLLVHGLQGHIAGGEQLASKQGFICCTPSLPTAHITTWTTPYHPYMGKLYSTKPIPGVKAWESLPKWGYWERDIRAGLQRPW